MVEHPDILVHGTVAWSSPEWREKAVSWLDEQLAARGVSRVGGVEQPHLRPWGTVLRAPTTSGVVWLKAAGPGTAFEVRLYELLARVAADSVLPPIAADPARGWMVLPDGGPVLGQRVTGPEMAEALGAALVRYGELQRQLTPCVDELLGLGVTDMRPSVMPERFDQALEATAGAAVHRRVEAIGETFGSWCDQLSASRVPASLDHNDLHPWNIFVGGSAGPRFYDWGDSVVAHPFAAMLVPLGFVQRGLDAGLDDARFTRLRDAYLEVFSDLAPGEDLVATLEVACRVAKVARVLTWDRALRTAREQGEEIAEDWTNAPLETLASLLDESYLGGA